ncbi:MAG: hypothetical protein JNJ59_17055 [Deltaproteobacteria bacterium]|nr:hypothetical protein [Deltaproteobacteria bacterium]
MGQAPVRLLVTLAALACATSRGRAEAPTDLGPSAVEAPPPGFYRDAEGREFQVQFDLNQRFWLGLGYRHTFFEDQTDGGGLALDLGFRVDTLSVDTRKKTRWRILELDLAPSTNGRLRLDASLMRFDTSTLGDRPFLALTTFIGGPARHDLYLQGGWWMDLLGVELREHRHADPSRALRLRYAALGAHWDLWQDADMTSFVRVRVGGAIDSRMVDDEVAKLSLTPLAALEGEFCFDDAGFHRLSMSAAAELELAPLASADLDPRWRFDQRLAYEVIALAIDDQPISLRLEGRATRRDGIDGGDASGWELAAEASLRVSLWAPPRDLAARDAARRLRSGHADAPISPSGSPR